MAFPFCAIKTAPIKTLGYLHSKGYQFWSTNGFGQQQHLQKG
jgi:hypothetical protein